VREGEAEHSDFEDTLMGMSPDAGFMSPKMPPNFPQSRFAPTTPLPPGQSQAFRGHYQNLTKSQMITNDE
jgi:hypothetical protein